uniref:Syndecan n=1 Tax=Malurus cyaneus samueli TaxID=2593467 RepID=A0A8C5TKQ1_9PASS
EAPGSPSRPSFETEARTWLVTSRNIRCDRADQGASFRWRNENYERPVDLEGTSLLSHPRFRFRAGAGAGYACEREPGHAGDTAHHSGRAAHSAAQPVATPLEPSPTPPDTTPGRATSAWSIPRTTEAPAMPSWTLTTTSTTASEAPTTTATTTTTMATTTTTMATTTTTTTTEATTTSSTTVATAKPTTIQRFLPPLAPSGHHPATTLATTQATTGHTLETPTTPSPKPARRQRWPRTPCPRQHGQAQGLPAPSTWRNCRAAEDSTRAPAAATPRPRDHPSGDFEIREEEDTTRPELGNEVVAVVTPPVGPGPGRNADSGLLDNTIDSGNSAAQLPQKNILERKEVLIAVIVGGVVGALFAAFLVMLLIYRMKKKDEGSYTLEEPKQANVTYQKPDKQEEFYA